MTRNFFLVPAIVAVLAGGLWAVIASQPKKKPAVDPDEVASSAQETPSGKLPKAHSERILHEFGDMDPFTGGSHIFTIRNLGEAPLVLKMSGTTCKCTSCEILDPEIPPRGEGRVQVDWTTAGRTNLFRHGCTVQTNDPETERIRLRVEGVVRSHIGADPGTMYALQVDPDSPRELESLVFSEAWESFEIKDVESDLVGVTWSLEPASRKRLDESISTALSGYVVRLTLPAGMPPGDFDHRLRMKVIPGGENADEEPLIYELGFKGHVQGRIRVIGEGIDKQGVIRLGGVSEGEGAKSQFIVKVRDTDPELNLTGVETVPEFIQISLKPYRSSEGKVTPSLYRLHLEIPRDAPPCTYSVTRPGTIGLQFDHPRIKKLDLKVVFSIIDET